MLGYSRSVEVEPLVQVLAQAEELDRYNTELGLLLVQAELLEDKSLDGRYSDVTDALLALAVLREAE